MKFVTILAVALMPVLVHAEESAVKVGPEEYARKMQALRKSPATQPDLQQENARLVAENKSLRAEVVELKNRIAALEKLTGREAAKSSPVAGEDTEPFDETKLIGMSLENAKSAINCVGEYLISSDIDGGTYRIVSGNHPKKTYLAYIVRVEGGRIVSFKKIVGDSDRRAPSIRVR